MDEKRIFHNCTNGKNGDHPTELTYEDIDTLFQSLFQSIPIKEDTPYGASPMYEKFFAFCPPELIDDITRSPAFLANSRVPAEKDPCKGEIGTIGHARIIPTDTAVLRDLSILGCQVYAIPFTYLDRRTKEYKEFSKNPRITKDMPVMYLHATASKKEKKDVEHEESKRAVAEVPRVSNDNWFFNWGSTVSKAEKKDG